jgi:hypothetical protein
MSSIAVSSPSTLFATRLTGANEFPMKGLRGAGEVRHVARKPLA